MITESELILLIREGETTRVDFKRELPLDTAANKAELVKDILSVANSANHLGYILIGVEDTGSTVGALVLEDERIQQIVHTYITPSIKITCSNIRHVASNQNIGVIEIDGKDRPYKVSRGIDRLNQNDTFVRHGSIVVRASPEEIIGMRNTTQNNRQYQRYLQAAIDSSSALNFENAIDYFSKAITLSPSSEVLILRGKAYLNYADQKSNELSRRTNNLGIFRYVSTITDKNSKQKAEAILNQISDQRKSYLRMALKDYSEAVIMAEDIEAEKKSRMLRQELLSDDTHYISGNFRQTVDDDVVWLIAHTNGEERGKVLYFKIRYISMDEPYFRGYYDEGIALFSEAIELGFINSEIYKMRAMAHSGAFNYGMALSDLKLAMNLAKSRNEILRIHLEHADTLSRAKQYREVYKLFQEIRKDFSKEEIGDYFQCTYDIIEELLLRFAIDIEFTQVEEQTVRLGKAVARYFSDWHKELAVLTPNAAQVIKQLAASNK